MSRAALSPATDIESFEIELGHGLGWRARIGMIALASGMSGEEEMHRLLPRDEVLLLTTRVANKNSIVMTTLAEMERDMTRAAATLLPEERLDVMIYCCTSGTIAMGEAAVTELIRRVKPEIAVTTPFTGVVAACRALGLRRLAMLAPYTREVTQAMRDHLGAKGLDLVRTATFGLALDSEICRVDPAVIRDAALAVDCLEAEAVFICCTGLRAADIIEELEATLGKPVLTSNQALAWHALRLAAYPDPVGGFGRLMRIDLEGCDLTA